MAMVKNVKRETFCAICKFYDGDSVQKYDPRSGSMTIENSGKKCLYHKKSVLGTQKACANFDKNPRY